MKRAELINGEWRIVWRDYTTKNIVRISVKGYKSFALANNAFKNHRIEYATA